MTKQVNISEDLYKKIEDRVSKTDEFENVDEYVKYILEEVVKKTESEEKDSEKDKNVYSKEDEERVKERLRGLGYLD